MSGDDEPKDAGEAVEGAIEGVGELAEGVGAALPEDGEAGEAREALETVGEVAGAAAGAVKAVRGVQAIADADGASDVAGGLGSAGQGAAGIVGAAAGHEARDAVGAVSRGVQVVGQAVEVFENMERALEGSEGHGATAGDRHEVEYHFEMASVSGRWGVREVDFHESLNEPYELTVRALLLEAHPEASELLGQDCTLSLQRGDHQRLFKGVVRKAKVFERHSGLNVRLTVVDEDLFFHDNPVPMEAFDIMMAGAGAMAAYLTAAGQAAEGNFGAAAMSVAQQMADVAALAIKQLRKIDPGAPPDVGTFLTGETTVLVGGIPLPPAKDAAAIIGALRGLAARIARRMRYDTDDGASARTGHPDDEPGHAGATNCPRA